MDKWSKRLLDCDLTALVGHLTNGLIMPARLVLAAWGTYDEIVN